MIFHTLIERKIYSIKKIRYIREINNASSDYSVLWQPLPFYLKVSKSILREVQCGALTHLRNGLANILNKTADISTSFGKFSEFDEISKKIANIFCSSLISA